MTVTGLVLLLFLSIVGSFYTIINRTSLISTMTIDSQDLLRSTVENLRFGNGVEQTNQITDPNQPGGWSTSNSNFVIIIEVPAVDSSHNYIIDPDTGSPFMNELVYYKNGSTLMERILANPEATGDSLITTCPPASATPSCPADTHLADNVSSMTFTLYDQNSVVTSTPSAARSIGITLNMQRYSPVDPINLSTNIRVTLRNRF
jgi:hypothetical protein